MLIRLSLKIKSVYHQWLKKHKSKLLCKAEADVKLSHSECGCQRNWNLPIKPRKYRFIQKLWQPLSTLCVSCFTFILQDWTQVILLWLMYFVYWCAWSVLALLSKFPSGQRLTLQTLKWPQEKNNCVFEVTIRYIEGRISPTIRPYNIELQPVDVSLKPGTNVKTSWNV